MPFVKIEVGKHWPIEQKKAIMNAVQESLVEALAVTPEKNRIRYQEYLSEDYNIPRGNSINYTIIEIKLLAGRTLEAKKNLYKTIVRNLKEIGIGPEDVVIILDELNKENISLQNGIPVSEA